MARRIFVENPPPFQRAPRGEERRMVDVPMDEGVEAIRFYLRSGAPVAGFHHSDLDRYESRQMRGKAPSQRYDSFRYAEYVEERLDGFRGILAPHRVVVYETPPSQEKVFRPLAERGIQDVVLVGKPYSAPPAGATYRSSVEEMLAHLKDREEDFGFTLGAIGIHLRRDEPERLARKCRAAGGRLRVMGQFLDEPDSMVAFLERLARRFETEGLDLGGLEYNVGLAILALKDRSFYARLLRKPELACERRFQGLDSLDKRIAESIRMNVEFAEQIREAGRSLGLDIGFSVQPLIERSTKGGLHRTVHAAAELAKRLDRLD